MEMGQHKLEQGGDHVGARAEVAVSLLTVDAVVYHHTPAAVPCNLQENNEN
jgi:hypothetical protein